MLMLVALRVDRPLPHEICSGTHNLLMLSISQGMAKLEGSDKFKNSKTSPGLESAASLLVAYRPQSSTLPQAPGKTEGNLIMGADSKFAKVE
jgi:hypothetical protein